jgi:hypothetical protein
VAHIAPPCLSNAHHRGAASPPRSNSGRRALPPGRRPRRPVCRNAPTNMIVISSHNARRLARSAPPQRHALEDRLAPLARPTRRRARRCRRSAFGAVDVEFEWLTNEHGAIRLEAPQTAARGSADRKTTFTGCKEKV